MALHVVLVEPIYEGNVGAVARAVKNFAATDLRLVRPCGLGEEARRRAMHGVDVLDAASSHATLEEALLGCALVVGTSGVETASERKFVRIAVTPREMAERARAADGDVGLVLGREDFGLRNEELAGCDLLVTIPANPEYPVLNVAHAAAILLYELHLAGASRRPRDTASSSEKEKLFEAFEDLLAVTNYPSHKRGRTTTMFRRLLGRATPSKWEFHALMGVLTRAAKTVRRERSRVGGGRPAKARARRGGAR